MAKTIYFVRHGESTANAGGPSLPHHSIPLTAKGHVQAAQVSLQLPSNAPLVLTSELVRTQQTAAPYLARLSLSAQTDALLNEFYPISFELIDGLDGAGRKPIAAAYWAAAHPAQRMGLHADTFQEFVARVDGFIKKLDELPDGTVIFGHGTWMAMLKWSLEGKAVDTGNKMLAFRKYMHALPTFNCVVYQAVNQNGQWAAHPPQDPQTARRALRAKQHPKQ